MSSHAVPLPGDVTAVMVESLQARDAAPWGQAAAAALAMNKIKPPLVGAPRWAARHDAADFAFASIVRMGAPVRSDGTADAVGAVPALTTSASLMSVRYCVSVEGGWVAEKPRSVAVLHIRSWSCNDVSVTALRLHLAALQAHLRACAGFVSTARLLGVSRVQVSARVQAHHVPAWCESGLPFHLASPPASSPQAEYAGDGGSEAAGASTGAGAVMAMAMRHAPQARVHVRWVWEL